MTLELISCRLTVQNPAGKPHQAALFSHHQRARARVKSWDEALVVPMDLSRCLCISTALLPVTQSSCGFVGKQVHMTSRDVQMSASSEEEERKCELWQRNRVKKKRKNLSKKSRAEGQMPVVLTQQQLCLSPNSLTNEAVKPLPDRNTGVA